jgi:hypothetical protein
MTDDRGLTSLDLARGKKMKATLKEAWIEATKGKPALDLAPIRAPSREEVRASVEEFNSKKKGEIRKYELLSNGSLFLHGSWIYSYLSNQYLSPLML